MHVKQPLKFYIYLENSLLIFRNVSFSDIKTRFIMYCAIIFEIILSISNGVLAYQYDLFYHTTDAIYFYIALGNSMHFILVSCYHSQSFKILLKCFDCNKHFVANDGITLKRFGRIRKILIITLVLYLALKICFGIIRSRYGELQTQGLVPFISVVLQMNASLWHLRFVMEYIILYILLYYMSEQLETIIRSVESEKKFLPVIYDPVDINITSRTKHRQYLNDISRWSHAYTYLAEASKLFNNIFGVQMTIMFVSLIAYVCIILYATASSIKRGGFVPAIIMKYIMKIVIYHIEIFSISRVAQRLHNNVDNLRRCLGKLLLHSLNDGECYHATRDLLRLVSSRRIKIQAFGSINVDMSLPPTCVMLFTSYTVIALQFNNVL